MIKSKPEQGRYEECELKHRCHQCVCFAICAPPDYAIYPYVRYVCGEAANFEHRRRERVAKPREKEMGWTLKVGSKHLHFHERVTGGVRHGSQTPIIKARSSQDQNYDGRKEC